MPCWIDLGKLDYQKCYDIQLDILSKVQLGLQEDTLLFVEHPAVLTLGSNFHSENLLLTQEQYIQKGIQVLPTDRGGDVTYHGPGQLVIYPIFNIAHYGKDLHKWLRDLEETMIQTLLTFDLKSQRFPPHTGVWINYKKIAAIGIKIKKWVNLHGIALNCNNDLSPFKDVIPCGIKQYGVTSLSQELNLNITPLEIIPKVIKAFENVFNIKISQNLFS